MSNPGALSDDSDVKSGWLGRLASGARARLVSNTRVVAIALLGLLVALVCLRSWVFLCFPHSHLDSDQAVFGLMGKDIALGRAFPLFMYGQRYMLAVGSWLCAPLFLIFGTSVTTLKLPMFLMNVASVAMLWSGLRRELGPWGAALSILPFAACGVICASRLVEHQGGNIEPIFFMLLAFALRTRPVALGVVFGIGFLNREFMAIGLIAMLLLDAVEGRIGERYKQRLTTLVVAAAVVAGVRFVAEHTPGYTGITASAHVRSLIDGEGIAGFFGQQLPTLLGATPMELRAANITSELTVGHAWLYYVAGAWALLALCGVTSFQRRDAQHLSTYLVLVGFGQAAAFILLCDKPRDAMLVRYILVCVCAWVGMTAWAWRRSALRPALALLVVVVCAFNVTDYLRLSREYIREPPRHENERLAAALAERGVKYAFADYWIAYDVSWLTDEAIVISPLRRKSARIARYQELVDAHADERVYIVDGPCDAGESLLRWNLCKRRPR